MNQDLQTAIDTITANAPRRERFSRYYSGDHLLSFATKKFKSAFGETLMGMRDNLCPIVVDAPADRMEVINFSGDEGSETVAEQAWELWQRELMELKSNEVHKDTLKTGFGYIIGWSVENQAKFYIQNPVNCCVVKDEETDVPLFGAKLWETKDKYYRLTMYYADRIEKYISTKKKTETVKIKAEHFAPVAEEESSVPNPYGVIPMFEFEADPVLADAIPIQDALNKTFADRMVTQEFSAFRQRWATGLEPPTDELTGIQKKLFDGGADRLWFTNEAAVKFGEFDASPLDPFLKAADSDRLEMARVSGTPMHFFSINTSDAISGKALKALEARFTKKVQRLTLNFGSTWAQVMKFALQIENTAVDNLTVQWAPVESQDEAELLDSQLKKLELGVPEETLWEELGYSEEDIAKFTKAREMDTEIVTEEENARAVAR